MAFLMLPNDLVLNCLSRISVRHYPRLSLVSKRFRSLLTSPELYQTRSFLGHSESCLYVSLKDSSISESPSWFTLWQKPNSSSKNLVPFSSPNSPFESMLGSVVVVDSSIYSFGGETGYPSSKVMVMDCHSYKCREAPRMQVARTLPSVCVLDGKIYVTGGYGNIDSTNWIEVFDIKTQTWEFLQIPSEEIYIGSQYKTVAYEGTIYVGCVENYASYKLHKGKWRATHRALNLVLTGRSSFCVIDNVLYSYSGGQISWYDSGYKYWRALEGLHGYFMSFYNRHNIYEIRLVDNGGTMAVLRDEYDIGYTGRTIYCAEIELERKQEKEIWGTLKWCEVIYKTNLRGDGLVDALATRV